MFKKRETNCSKRGICKRAPNPFFFQSIVGGALKEMMAFTRTEFFGFL
jgi:hypothetical protein